VLGCCHGEIHLLHTNCWTFQVVSRFAKVSTFCPTEDVDSTMGFVLRFSRALEYVCVDYSFSAGLPQLLWLPVLTRDGTTHWFDCGPPIQSFRRPDAQKCHEAIVQETRHQARCRTSRVEPRSVCSTRIFERWGTLAYYVMKWL
jgi:hypothetical protein